MEVSHTDDILESRAAQRLDNLSWSGARPGKLSRQRLSHLNASCTNTSWRSSAKFWRLS